MDDQKGVKNQLINELVDIKEKKISHLTNFPRENPNPVLKISRSGEILYSNKASKPLFETWDIKDGQPLPKDWIHFVENAIKEKQPQRTEAKYHEGTCSLTFAPVTGADFVNVYGSDVSEQKKAEAQIRKHTSNLEKMVKMRTKELEKESKRLVESQQALTYLLEDVNQSRKEIEEVNKKLEGASSYVQKPIDFNQFVESVKQLGLYWLILNEMPPYKK